jgi:hypothetical protein
MHVLAIHKRLFAAITFGALMGFQAAFAFDPVSIPATSVANPNMSSLTPDGVHITQIPGLVTVGALSKNGTSASGIDNELIQSGSFLLSPDRSLSIKTNFATITIEGRSVDLLFVAKQAVSLYDLDEMHKGGTSLIVNGQTINLQPGEHITVTTAVTDKFATVNNQHFISHRKLQSSSIDKLKVYKSEFNIFTAINSIESLHESAAAPIRRQKRAVNHLLKTAAIQNELANGGGKVIETGGPISFQFVTE